jgi:phage tail sheath protein FI
MTTNYRTPGVYVEEVSKLPPSVVPVETAIPAFFGYTELTQYRGQSLVNHPVEISSALEFEQIFGLAPAIGSFSVSVDPDGDVIGSVPDPNGMATARFRLSNAIRHFYDNGGGRCYVVSLGDYSSSSLVSEIATAHTNGLAALAREDEPTLLVMPDLSGMAVSDPEDDEEVASVRAAYHGVLIQALAQCARLQDRFLICDLWDGAQAGTEGVTAFRDGIGTSNLQYGAAYHPFIRTTLPWRWDESTITIEQLSHRAANGTIVQPSPFDGLALDELASGPIANTTIYANVKRMMDRHTVVLPPAASVAGVYATVDRTRGVWKAPANTSLASTRSLTVEIDDDFNAALNVDPTGKSINALRFFTGKGNLVWGARTLAGNDNEWRHVSVRRFFNMVEESTKKATERFVFEPNDANTWAKVRSMISNFLLLQWRQGALAGATPDDAFYVRLGLGVTMTAQDILEGRMNVEIGMAVVRPAEFIILKFSHKLQEA